MNEGKVFVVPGLSAETIELRAKLFLQKTYPYLLDAPDAFPAQQFFERDLYKLFGFHYSVQDLPSGISGTTDFDPDRKELILSANTYEQLLEEDGRARFTVLHEAGHIFLHKDYMSTLSTTRSGLKLNRSMIPAYQDPEWQANYFAGAVMLPRHHIIKLISQGKFPQDIKRIFKTSRQAVDIRLSKLKLDPYGFMKGGKI